MQEPKYYVYILIDPRKNIPFYVGKGKGNRAHSHTQKCSKTRNKYKDNVIEAIQSAGLQPGVEFHTTDIENEAEAYSIEAALIAAYGRKGYEPHGILTNVCLDSRPPSHKGRSYEEIYGPERAKEQIKKRRDLQKAAGGYGPKKFHPDVCARLSEMRKGRKIGPMSQETKNKISANAKHAQGADNPRSVKFELCDPSGQTHVVFSKKGLVEFCEQQGLTYVTFMKGLSLGWAPSTRGRNVGWTITKTTPKQ